MTYINPTSSGINGTSQKTSSEIKKELEELESTVSSLSTTVANNAKIIGSTTHTLPTSDISTMVSNAVTTSKSYADTQDAEITSAIGTKVTTSALQVNGDTSVLGKLEAGQIVTEGTRAKSKQTKVYDLDVTNEVDTSVIKATGYINVTGTAESTIPTLTSTTLKATNATIDKETVTDLTATKITTDTYTVNKDITLTEKDSTTGLTSTTEIKATKIVTPEVHTNLVTVNPDGWIDVGSSTQNDKLIQITLYDYNGIINIITGSDALSVSIFNNSYVTFCQSSLYLYRVSFNSDSTVLYFESIPGNHYAFVNVGAGTFKTPQVEIVSKATIQRNINVNKGCVTSSPISEEGGNTDYMYLYLESMPTSGVDKCIYIVKDADHPTNNNSYIWRNDTFVPITDAVESFSTDTTGDNAYKPTVDFTTELADEEKHEAVSTNTGNVDKLVTSRELYNDVRKPLRDIVFSKGQKKGIASLDKDGHIPVEQMPTSSLYIVGYLDGATHPSAPEIKDTYVNGAQVIVTGDGYYTASTAFTVKGGEEITLTELEVGEANYLITLGYVFTLKNETTGTTYESKVKSFATDGVTLEDDTVIALPNADTLSATSEPDYVRVDVSKGDVLTLIDGHWIHMSNTTYVSSVDGRKGAVSTIDDYSETAKDYSLSCEKTYNTFAELDFDNATELTSSTELASTDTMLIRHDGTTYKGTLSDIIKAVLQTTYDSTSKEEATKPVTSSAVTDAINLLDQTAVGGGDAEYISKISEADGLITATKSTASTSSSSIVSNNKELVTGGAVSDALANFDTTTMWGGRNLVTVLGVSSVSEAITWLNSNKSNPTAWRNKRLMVGDYLDISSSSFDVASQRVCIAEFDADGHYYSSYNPCLWFTFKDCIALKQHHTTSTNSGGYPSSDIRTYLNDSIYSALVSIGFSVRTANIFEETDSGTSWDWQSEKVFLPTESQVYGHGCWGDKPTLGFTANSGQPNQLPYYALQPINRKKYYNGSNYWWWWLQNPAWKYPDSSICFCNVRDNGYAYYGGATLRIGVSPLFIL